jgi:hypothetical protein
MLKIEVAQAICCKMVVNIKSYKMFSSFQKWTWSNVIMKNYITISSNSISTMHLTVIYINLKKGNYESKFHIFLWMTKISSVLNGDTNEMIVAHKNQMLSYSDSLQRCNRPIWHSLTHYFNLERHCLAKFVEHGLCNHPKKYAMDYTTKIIGYWLPRKILQLVLLLFQAWREW